MNLGEFANLKKISNLWLLLYAANCCSIEFTSLRIGQDHSSILIGQVNLTLRAGTMIVAKKELTLKESEES